MIAAEKSNHIVWETSDNTQRRDMKTHALTDEQNRKDVKFERKKKVKKTKNVKKG